MKRPEQLLVDLFKKNKLSIAFAESMSCGLLTHKIGSICDTSEVLTGSIICYDEHIKTGLLKVKKKLIKTHTAESQQVTDSLAVNLGKLMPADVHAAITGLAAPGGTETKSKPVGTVFYSFVFRGKIYRLKKHFTGTPLQVKEKACKEFFRFIVKEVKAHLPDEHFIHSKFS